MKYFIVFFSLIHYQVQASPDLLCLIKKQLDYISQTGKKGRKLLKKQIALYQLRRAKSNIEKLEDAQKALQNSRRRGGRSLTLHSAESKRLKKLLTHQISAFGPEDIMENEIGNLYRTVHSDYFEALRLKAEVKLLESLKQSPNDKKVLKNFLLLQKEDFVDKFTNAKPDNLVELIDTHLTIAKQKKSKHTYDLVRDIDFLSSVDKELRKFAKIPNKRINESIESIPELLYSKISNSPLRGKSEKMKAREVLSRLNSSFSIQEYWKTFGLNPKALIIPNEVVSKKTKNFLNLVLGDYKEFRTPKASDIYNQVLDGALSEKIAFTRNQVWEEWLQTLTDKFLDRDVAIATDSLIGYISKKLGYDFSGFGLKETIQRNRLRSKYYDELDVLFDGQLGIEALTTSLISKSNSYIGKSDEFLQVAYLRPDTRPMVDQIIFHLEENITNPAFKSQKSTLESYLSRFKNAKELADKRDFRLPAAYEPRSSEKARLLFTPVYMAGAAVTTYLGKKALDYFNFTETEQDEIIHLIQDEDFEEEIIEEAIQKEKNL